MEFSVHICEYNRSNADYETIYRPEGSGDYLFLWIKNSILRNSIRFTQILTAPEMDIAVAKLLNSLIMLLVIRRVKKAGIFLCNEKRSSVIHLHRRFKQQKQIVPAQRSD